LQLFITYSPIEVAASIIGKKASTNGFFPGIFRKPLVVLPKGHPSKNNPGLLGRDVFIEILELLLSKAGGYSVF
jgi:hypothetical protein